MGTLVKVASLADLPPGTTRMAEANGKEIALYNVDGTIYATTNICPHQGGPLAEGILEGTSIICPWHAWAFDIVNGTSPVNPRMKIETYPVKIDNNDVFVEV
jgi:NAD(P)H-dependent nitrite reductase small subunit